MWQGDNFRLVEKGNGWIVIMATTEHPMENINKLAEFVKEYSNDMSTKDIIIYLDTSLLHVGGLKHRHIHKIFFSKEKSFFLPFSERVSYNSLPSDVRQAFSQLEKKLSHLKTTF